MLLHVIFLRLPSQNFTKLVIIPFKLFPARQFKNSNSKVDFALIEENYARRLAIPDHNIRFSVTVHFTDSDGARNQRFFALLCPMDEPALPIIH